MVSDEKSSLKLKTTKKCTTILTASGREMAFTNWKPPQYRFTSPSIHLRRVGYYKTITERSEAQGDGIYTLETTAI